MIQVHQKLLCAAGLLLLPARFAAAQPATPYTKINAAAEAGPVVVTPIRGKFAMLSGSGGNIALLAGPGAMLMVDGGIAVSRQRIEQAVHRLGAGRVRYLINTHWHCDHTDGNAWLHKAGATILATPLTAKRLGSTIRIAEWGHTFIPAPLAARPEN